MAETKCAWCGQGFTRLTYVIAGRFCSPLCEDTYCFFAQVIGQRSSNQERVKANG